MGNDWLIDVLKIVVATATPLLVGLAIAIARKMLKRLGLELEAEQQRLRLVRNALLTQGLEAANRRPCAWWFPLVDPSMQWWEEVVRTTEMYFEEWR